MIISETTRYLVVPTNERADVTKLRLYDGGRLLCDLDAKVDFACPESVMYYDLAPWMGLDITVSHASGKSFGFSEKLPAAYEPTRPRLHFTASRGWINDPNGLVYYEGAYHLFFQHNPVGRSWGNMHWGHAVSRDLVHWQELGDALYPDELGDMFSGSAIVDYDNLLGLKENEHDVLLLYYTAAGSGREISAGQPFTQCMAYSTDGARSFKKYSGNPVMPHIKGSNRDPKVIRDPESGKYVMSLYLDGDEYALLISDNLVDWKQLQTISLPGDNECPDFYPLRDSDGSVKWALTGAHDCCLIGSFDPEHGFAAESIPYKFGFGAAYAAQTFSVYERDDGVMRVDMSRRLRLSWNRFTSLPSKYYNCEMSLPCELTLKSGRLSILPAPEFEAAFEVVEDSRGLPTLGVVRELPKVCELTLEISRIEEPIRLRIYGSHVTLDAAAGRLNVGDESMPLYVDDGRISLRIIADGCGLEIFNSNGSCFGTFQIERVDSQLVIGGEGSLDRMVIATEKGDGR